MKLASKLLYKLIRYESVRILTEIIMSSTIDASSMLMQMNTMRMQATGGVSQDLMTPTAVNASNGDDFGAMLKNALETVNEIQNESNDLKTRFELGDRSISLANVMVSSQKAGIALEATVQVRNKMVEAYKTIMQMQI
jgi:flagellar hook-basal body complex protein FliE